MEFQEDIKRIEEDVKEIKKDVKQLMIFMAVKTVDDTKKAKHVSAIVAIICSVTSSGIMFVVAKYLGG